MSRVSHALYYPSWFNQMLRNPQLDKGLGLAK
jgi:hypothetical protein